MSLHPLIELAADKDVRRAATFRKVATELNGEQLAERYQQEQANAPRRQEAGRKYFVAYNSRLGAQRKPGRDDEHASLALARQGGSLKLPDEAGEVEFVQAQIPLRSAAPDKARGAEDPNHGVGRLDLIGIGPDDRMVIGAVRYLAPSAARGRTGDTPLRALLEALASTAIAQANHSALAQEVAEKAGRSLSDAPPLLLFIGSPRYWELCRRREAQKGAAWIKEMERLAGEIEESIGIGLIYLACKLDGDPGWTYDDSGPLLEGPARLDRSWEYGAGRVRPKPRPRPKQTDPADQIVEPDLSRPIRPYQLSESYEAGDRIEHPKLGLGVVQGIAGNGKISVLFEERKSVLVHERGAPAPA